MEQNKKINKKNQERLRAKTKETKQLNSTPAASSSTVNFVITASVQAAVGFPRFSHVF